MTTGQGYILEEMEFKGRACDVLKIFEGEAYLFCLESSQFDDERGRYSFIGFDPFDTVVCSGEQSLKVLRDRYRIYGYHESQFGFFSTRTPLVCGIVGFLGYDFGLHQEGISRYTQDDLNLPECVFGFYDCILTVDHAENKLILTSSGLPERNGEAQCQRARRRAAKVMERLKAGLSCYQGASAAERPELTDDLPDWKWKSDFSKIEYMAAVQTALDYIGRGDIYQVNLSQRFVFDVRGKVFSPIDFYRTLQSSSPASFAGYFNGGGFQLISNSPERFFQLRDDVVSARPMKGTRPRGKAPEEDLALYNEILKSEKDKAELLMITDLLRNDLGKVCDYGSVRVEVMRIIEKYAYVFQATSSIKGTLKRGMDGFDILQACFPGGSITGCPKIRAMEIIEQLEPTRRGPYTGALGYVSFNGDMDFNILIRTIVMHKDQLYFQTGGGIVADSTPEGEYEETLIKAAMIKDCLRSYFACQSAHVSAPVEG